MRHKLFIPRLTSAIAAFSMFFSVAVPATEAAVTTLLAPQAGERLTGRNVEIAVGYNTESDLKVTDLELYIDGKLLAAKTLDQPVTRGVSSFWWDPGKAGEGLHNIAVKVYAGDKLIGTARSSATVGESYFDLDPPSVKLAGIKPGQELSGKTRLTVESVDDSGGQPIVSLHIDGALKMLSNSRPCTYELDTTQYADGDHEISLVAFDASGNKSDPTVTKVKFKNDLAPTTVALPKAEPQPKTIAASEDDYAPQIPPIEKVVPHSSSAARSPQPRVVPAPVPAKPVVVTKPAPLKPAAVKPIAPPKPVVVKPAPVKAAPAKPIIAAKPVPVALAPAKPIAVTKPAPVKPITAAKSAPVRPAPAKPIAVAKPSAQPKTEPIRVAAVPSTVLKPTALPIPAQLPPVELPALATDAVEVKSEPPVQVVVPKVELPKPVQLTSEPPVEKPVVVRKPVLNPPPVVGSVIPTSVVAQPSLQPLEPTVSDSPVPDTKPIKTAMLLTKEVAGDTSKPTVTGPSGARKDATAKLEKKSFQSSGKMKLRDLIHDMGGVLFWDPASKVVTAYAPGLEIEAKIGSKVAKINGKTVQLDEAPTLVNGRTIINSGLGNMARQMAGSRTAPIDV